jgi:hypothetical protein
MYRNTRFGELLKALPRNSFNRCVEQHQSDRYYKDFSSWDHMISLMFAQLSDCRSLRELEASYNGLSSYHHHLGCGPIHRSTVSDANRDRDASVFESFCETLMGMVNGKARSDIKDFLYLLDSSPICLRGRGYEWTEERGIPRIPGLKLHVLYQPTSMLPSKTSVTSASVNDVEYGQEIELEEGAKYVFDKGYCDYNWWNKIDQAGASFVTRLKRNAAVNVLGRRQVSGNILSDEVIQFKHKRPGGKRKNEYRESLRRIVVQREGHDEPLVLVTNLLEMPADEVAELYKKRWAIELWFKWIKQNLKIKKFLGRTENAVKVQIFVALITYLLAYLYRQMSGIQKELYLWLAELKSTLFQRPKLEYEMYRRRRKHRSNFLKQQHQLTL